MNLKVEEDQVQFVNARISSPMCKEEVMVTAAYASCHIPTRRQLWEGLSNTSSTTLPWIVMGDFNVIKGLSEQVGCKALDPRALEDFNDCIMYCRLEDAGYCGSSLSWSNGRISKRLDRVLHNQSYGELYTQVKVKQLAKTLSDHAPMLVYSNKPKDGPKGSFKFQKMWFHHPEFIKLVEDNWLLPLVGDPLFVLGMKLKRLKGVLREWNKETFGNVFTMVERAEEEVQECEADYEQSPTPEHREALQRTKANHLKCLAIEEDFLSQQSGIKWLAEGDKNTGFYHNYIRKRRKQSAVLGILEEGAWLTDSEEIAASGVNYFKDLFTGDTTSEEVELVDCIPSLVTSSDNEMLMAVPELEEVRRVVFSLNKDSVAGPDGFNGHFFHNFWNLIAMEVLAVVRHFMAGSPLHQSFTSTSIVLIPKGDHPKSWKEYRPISLCTFVNKIMSKLLNARISTILPKLISPFQAGFVPGRIIQDNILLAQELMHQIDAGKKEGNVILNLDMAKAFDRLSWNFLHKVLAKFGFSEAWIDRVLSCLGNNWFSLILNGKAVGFFKSEKGVRQGDPLSPALFILAEEYLLRGLHKLYTVSPELAYKSGSSVKVPALAFADDVLIFSNGSKAALSKIMHFLNHYQTVSGQLVSTEKSSFIMSNKAPNVRCTIVQRTTNFRRSTAPLLYLGIPIYKGKKQIFLFEDLVEKIRARLASWSSNFLSFGGRITLLQSVLTALPVYYLQVMQMPVQVTQQIQRIFNKFLWDGTPWCKWSTACAPFEEGGLNLRSLEEIHKTFMHKAWLRMREGKCLWSQFMLDKYCRKHHPRLAPVHPAHSRVWKCLHKVRDSAEDMIHWQVGEGSCDFWLDSWMDIGPLFKLYQGRQGGTKVQDLWQQGKWDEDKLSSMISQEHLSKVKAVFIDHGSPDRAIWKESIDGNFSFKGTYEELRHKRNRSALYAAIWHSNIPRKMSFLAWRLMRGCLPVDEVMQQKGISLASKCQCCQQIETVVHIFFTNHIADQVWGHFAQMVGIKHLKFSSILQICQRVTSILTANGRANMLQAKFWSGDSYIASILGAHTSVKHRHRPALVSWSRPTKGNFKLNIDAAFKEGQAGYGGILRNDQGQLVDARGIFGLCPSALEAEVEALLSIMKWCSIKGYSRMHIEVDTLQLVHMIHGNVAHWQLSNKLAYIRKLLTSLGSHITHIYREKNMIADWIAKHSCKNKQDYNWGEGPDTVLRRLVKLDLGLPQLYFR
ncbi:reverse transcriptase [Lithospermum erythrorhizon]|uniref:Reverse transcriptase n=1 Tax=Lithospermum erythrorhizon TaxID=34254 RepID=A0AAV3QZ30_LITER